MLPTHAWYKWIFFLQNTQVFRQEKDIPVGNYLNKKKSEEIEIILCRRIFLVDR